MLLQKLWLNRLLEELSTQARSHIIARPAFWKLLSQRLRATNETAGVVGATARIERSLPQMIKWTTIATNHPAETTVG